jgi:hypothetical protein
MDVPNPYAHNQRLLDLLKSLELKWPEQAMFSICFNRDPDVGLVSAEIKTATITIAQAYDDDLVLGIDDLPVGHC